jgi:hypothetical protein
MRAHAILGALALSQAALVSPARAAPPAPSVVILPGAPGTGTLAIPLEVAGAAEDGEADRTKLHGRLAAGVTMGAASVVMGAFALRVAGTDSPSPRPEANDLPGVVGFSIASAVGGAVLASALSHEAPAGLRVMMAIGPGGAGLVVSGHF